MTDEEFRQALLAEQFGDLRAIYREQRGPLAAERTRPIAKRFPSRRDPQVMRRTVFINATRTAPWMSNENRAEAGG